MNKEETLNIIKSTIYKMHPIKKPRVNITKLYTIGAPEMEVELYFFEDKNNILKTQVIFSDGNYYHKTSKSYFTINNLINKEIVIDLINFLLEEFPIISNFNVDKNSLSLEFSFSSEKNMTKGISCRRLKLIFISRENTHIINDYLKCILDNYSDKLSSTPLFKERYEEYLNNNKKEMINTLNKEELKEIINLLSEEELKNLLQKLPHDTLNNAYNEYVKEGKPKQKRLKKEISN